MTRLCRACRETRPGDEVRFQRFPTSPVARKGGRTAGQIAFWFTRADSSAALSFRSL